MITGHILIFVLKSIIINAVSLNIIQILRTKFKRGLTKA